MAKSQGHAPDADRPLLSQEPEGHSDPCTGDCGAQSVSTAPKNRRGAGQVSHLLLEPGQFGARNLAITFVEGAPGSRRSLHADATSEQVCLIVRGLGRMTVTGEEREVTAGTLIFIPVGAQHAIENHGTQPLVYMSATSPPFEMPVGGLPYEKPGSQVG